MSKMRKKMDFLSSETEDEGDVSDVDAEELQKMLEVINAKSRIFYCKLAFTGCPIDITTSLTLILERP